MGRYSKEYYLENRKKISKIRHEYYLRNKEKIIERNNRWRKNNITTYQTWRKNYYNNVWYPKNKNKMIKLMKKQYNNHKIKFISRAATLRWINGDNKNYKSGKVNYRKIDNPPIKECEKCKTQKNLQIYHEVYPIKKAEIIQAIKNGKIYYLCKSCHYKLRLFQKE